MLVRKGIKFEKKSDSIRMLVVPLAVFARWAHQSIWKSYTYARVLC